MPHSWKLVLIGGEVTVLAAFTVVGLHLALQPHRFPVPPPPLLIRTPRSPSLPSLAMSPLRPPASPAAQKSPGPSLGPEWFSKLGQQDHRLLFSQWEILQRLIGAMERYIERNVIPAMEGHR